MPPDAISTAQIDELLRHREWMTRLAYRLVGNRADADDLVQIALERTLRRPPQRPEALRGWLSRIVHNAASNLRRDRARAERKIRIHEAQLAESDDSRRISASESAERIELQRIMLEGLTWLPEHHREPLFLRYERDLDHQAIGAEMGISPEAARKRVSRALSSLRDAVEARLGANWREKLAAAFGLPLPAVAAPVTALVITAAATVLLTGGAWFLIRPAGSPVESDRSVAVAAPDPAAQQPTDLAPASLDPAAAAEMGPGIRAPVPGPPEDITRPRALFGRVLDETGRPFPKVEVLARCGGEEGAGVVEEDGSYSLLLDPSWDDRLVTVVVRGKGTSTRIQALGSELAGQSRDLLFRSGRFQRVRAVEAGSGKPVEGVELHASQGEFVAIGTSGPDGLIDFHLAGERVYTLGAAPNGFGRHATLAGDSAFLLSPDRPDSVPLEIPLWVSPLRFELVAADAVTGEVLASATFHYRERKALSWDSTGGFLLLDASNGELSVPNPNPRLRAGVWVTQAGFAPEFVLMNRDLGQPTIVELEREEDVVVTVLGPDRAPIAGASLQWSRNQPAISLAPEEKGGCWVDGASPISAEGEATIPAPLDLEDLSFAFRVVRNGIALADAVKVSGRGISPNRTFELRLETKADEAGATERLGILALAGRIEETDGGRVPAGLLAKLVTADTGELLEQRLLDPRGRFEFSDLPDRPLVLQVEEGDIRLAEFPVRPPATGLSFPLPPFRTLTVRPLDTTALPPAGLVKCIFFPDEGLAQNRGASGGRDVLFDRLPLVPGWLIARIAETGAWVAVRIRADMRELTMDLPPGRTAMARVDYPGSRLPEEVRCRIVGADPDDPRWREWRELDRKGRLFLYGAPMGRFEIELVVDGVAGEPIPVD